MRSQIVAVSIDKVQAFLYSVITAQTQEEQTEKHTLRQILYSTQELSYRFHKRIAALLPLAESGRESLLSCSGASIFTCDLPTDQIYTKLDDLYAQYYQMYSGKARVRFACFANEGYTEIQAIAEAIKRLSDPVNMSQMIKRSANMLFAFTAVDKKTPHAVTSDYPYYAEDLNDLYAVIEEARPGIEVPDRNTPSAGVKRSADDHPPPFRIALIEADLDGMGDLFKEIINETRDFSTYTRVSEALNRHISLKNLHSIAADYAHDNCLKQGQFKIYPLYMAGDDIFFAVSVEHLFSAVNLVKKLLEKLNKELVGELHAVQETKEVKQLTVSIGIDIAMNSQPIRYYYERVEDQMARAKAQPLPTDFMGALRSRITINGYTFFDVDESKVAGVEDKTKSRRTNPVMMKNPALKNEPIWNHFIHDVKVLNYIRSGNYSELLGTRNFFYSLLERLTDPTTKGDPIRYLNTLLYHLIPQYIGSTNPELMEQELMLNHMIIKQLFIKSPATQRFEMQLDDSAKARLETYVWLMLLFSDARFSIYANPLKKDEFCASIKQDQTRKDIKGYLFSKPLRTLREKCLRGDIFGFFVRDLSCKADVKAVVEYTHMSQQLKAPLYMTLRTDSSASHSAFQKMKHILSLKEKGTMSDADVAAKIALLIALNNPAAKDDLCERNKQRLDAAETKESYRPSTRLFFDQDAFTKAFQARPLTSTDIDSLMVFYQYDKSLADLRRIWPSNKKEKTR